MTEPIRPAADTTVTSLAQAQRLLRNIAQIIRLLNDREAKLTDSLSRILELLLDYIGVEQGSIMVQEGKELVVAAATRAELLGMRQPLVGTSVAAWVARTGKPIFIPDIAKDERFQARGGVGYKKNAVLSAPIIQNGRLLGVINATDKGGDKDLLNEDIAYLLDFSSLIISSLVQQQMHQELQRQRNTLKKKNQELKRQERLRDELYRMLIHDLKAPLAEVVANLDILSYSLTGDGREFLEAAQMGCERTVSMVSNLISTNKIEDGKLKPSLEEVTIPGLLEEARSAITGLARIKNIDLLVEAEEGLPSIFIDRVLILRVLQNLLTNALGHCDSDAPIRIGCRRLPTGQRLEFYVADQGPGIPEGQQEGIFDKYSRLSCQQDFLVGTGLGLYFCKLAVELHRGRIGVDSAPGRGARFFFILPVA